MSKKQFNALLCASFVAGGVLGWFGVRKSLKKLARCL